MELGLCNKGPVSGLELQAIKTAATDLGETAGIYPRNPDYVATAGAEQKAPSSWKAKRWQVMSNQLHYPTVPASPTRVRASSHHIRGGGISAAAPASRQAHQEEGEGPAPQPTQGPGCSRQGHKGLQGCSGDIWQGKWAVVPKIRAVLCKSKIVVFHSGPSLEACTGLPARVKRDRMMSNLVKIFLAGLAPGSNHRPPGDVREDLCSLLSCG